MIKQLLSPWRPATFVPLLLLPHAMLLIPMPTPGAQKGGAAPAATQSPTRPARYVGGLVDGTRLAGRQLDGWPAQLRLDGQPLPRGPAAWLRDRRRPAGTAPAAVIVTWLGDQIPGTVLQYQAPSTNSQLAEASGFFRVRATAELGPPRRGASASSPATPSVTAAAIRIRGDAVRRIVWTSPRNRESPDPGPLPPGRLLFRDGRELAFRSLRLGSDGVSVLTPAGIRRARFDELAQLSFPERDPWSQLWAELAQVPELIAPASIPPPAAAAASQPDPPVQRWRQFLTDDHLRVTAAECRVRLVARGQRQDESNWLYVVQPAWSLDALWIPATRVRLRRWYSANCLPLSRLPPLPSPDTERADSSVPLKRLQRYPAIDANVVHRPLQSGGREFGWGLGVHAPATVRFPLAAPASRLLLAVGLDPLAGKGGRVRAAVVLRNSRGGGSRRLWHPSALTGSQTVHRQNVALPPTAEESPARQLELHVDSLADTDPTADPLNIRDVVNWLEPTLVLDWQGLRHHQRRQQQRQFTWPGWKLLSSAERLQVACNWDDAAPPPGTFVNHLRSDQPIEWEYILPAGRNPAYLVIQAGCREASDRLPQIEVDVAGKKLRFDVPRKDLGHADAKPIIVPVSRTVPRKDAHKNAKQDNPAGPGQRIRLRQLPSPVAVHWEALQFTGQLPTLRVLLDDEPPTGANPPMARQPGYAGSRAWQLRAAQSWSWVPAGPIQIRAQPRLGQFRFLRMAVRCRAAGDMLLTLNHTAAGTATAAAGQVPIGGATKDKLGRQHTSYGLRSPRDVDHQLWFLPTADHWIVVTRDLFADLGPCDVQRLTFTARGEPLLLDHIWLASHPDDLERLSDPPHLAPSAKVTNAAARRHVAVAMADKTIPAIALLQPQSSSAFTAGGVVIDGGRRLLTAAHLLPASGTFSVRLADGTTATARRLGVDRQQDLGVASLQYAGPATTHLRSLGAPQPPSTAPLAALVRSNSKAQQKTAAELTALRRLQGGMLWTDFDSADALPGMPLIDPQGRLLGIRSRTSPFGGSLYAHLQPECRAEIDELAAGTSRGTWHADIAPHLGLKAVTMGIGEQAQCQIKQVTPGGPADSAGLKPGDQILQLEDAAVSDLAQLTRALSTLDPAQKVIIRYRRNRKQQQAKLTLAASR